MAVEDVHSKEIAPNEAVKKEFKQYNSDWKILAAVGILLIPVGFIFTKALLGAALVLLFMSFMRYRKAKELKSEITAS